jgi:sec-independent protein translocase protein TatC
MWATTRAKIVELGFWKQNMKYIVIVLVILGAFLTPDGSGLSMWLISGPLIILYVVGLTVIKITSKYSQKVREVSQE